VLEALLRNTLVVESIGKDIKKNQGKKKYLGVQVIGPAAEN
jgi:hypothetical protein